MRRPFFRAWDLIPVLLALCGAVVLLLPRGGGAAVEVRQEGEIVAVLPLDRDAEFVCGGVTVTVRDGAAFVSEADCPDKLCVAAGRLTKAGDAAVCLPNRVTLTVTGAPAHDGVTY